MAYMREDSVTWWVWGPVCAGGAAAQPLVWGWSCALFGVDMRHRVGLQPCNPKA